MPTLAPYVLASQQAKSPLLAPVSAEGDLRHGAALRSFISLLPRRIDLVSLEVCLRTFRSRSHLFLGSTALFLPTAAAVLLGATATAAFAQSTAQVSGTVTDTTGAVVPNAKVTVRETGTNATSSVTSNQDGIFAATNLEPGPYEVTVTSPGFGDFKENIVVTVGARVNLDAKLPLANSTVQVEVSADSSAQVNTDTPEVSQVINQQQITELPSLTRNPYDFVALSGNISGGDNTATGYAQNGAIRGVGFSLNGSRNSGTEVLLDGVENIQVFSDAVSVIVPVDTVQEYRVITNNFSPEYGRASGGVVSVVTRSGTNDFHGRAWEFNRISATTANTVTNAQQGAPKGQYTRNQFGGIIGGPVKKDKLFFFASTEFTRIRSAATQVVAVASPQLIAASAANIQSYFNTYGPTVSGTTVNSTTNLQAGGGKTPLYANLPANLPVFNNVAFTAPTDAGGGLPQNTYNVTGRLDYNLSSKTQMFFRYVNYHEIDQLGAAVASPYAQYNVGASNTAQAYLLSVAHSFNSAFSTIGRISFARNIVANSYDTALQNTPTLNVAPSAIDPFSGNNFYTPGFYPTNPANGGLPAGGPQNTIQYNHDLSYTVAKHQIQGGAQVLYIQENQAYGAYAQANEQLGKSQSTGFQNLLTGNLFRFQAAVNPKGATPCARDPYTRALVQTTACTVTLPTTSPAFARSDRFHDWAAYIQDTFKATPAFSLSYGVRYEYFGVQHNNNPNLDSNFYYGAGSNLFQQIRNGSVLTVPNSPIHSLWNPQYGTVSPRIGFAYDVFGNQKTSLRGGYGISYERNFGNVTFNLIQNPPNYAVVVLQSGNGQNYTVSNSNLGPLAASSGSVALPPSSLRHVDQNIRTAQTQFASASIDQQLTRNTILEISYNHSRGIHLYDIKNLNIAGEGNLYLGDPLTDPAGRINPATGQVYTALTPINTHFSNDNQRGSNGDSHYDAVNLQFNTKDIRHSGLSVIANYTFGHELDDLSSTFSETAAGNFNLGYTDATNPSLDYASGDNDVRHRLVLAPIYQTPFFYKNKGSWLGQLLGGYELTGIYTVRSGTPFTFYDSTFNNSGYQVARYNPLTPVRTHNFTKIPTGQTGGGTNQYTLTGPTTLPLDVPFGNPALGGISDLGPYPHTMEARNTFRGPGAYNLNVSVSKTFPIYERFNLELRAEGYDVTNHHNLYIEQSQDDAANFAGTNPQIVARKGGIFGGYTDERRFLQFAGKINF